MIAKNVRFLAASTVAGAGLLLVGCSVADQVGAVAPAAVSNPQPVDARTYGAAWPLTVESGAVTCFTAGGTSNITFTAPDRGVYALNGNAESNRYPKIDDLADPSSTNTLWTLRSLGVRICAIPPG